MCLCVCLCVCSLNLIWKFNNQISWPQILCIFLLSDCSRWEITCSEAFHLLWHLYWLLPVTVRVLLGANHNILWFSICLHFHHLSRQSHCPSRREPWRMTVTGGRLMFFCLYRWCVTLLEGLWCSLCLAIKMYGLIWLYIVMTKQQRTTNTRFSQSLTDKTITIYLCKVTPHS